MTSSREKGAGASASAGRTSATALVATAPRSHSRRVKLDIAVLQARPSTGRSRKNQPFRQSCRLDGESLGRTAAAATILGAD
jgi:hypothetical protein